MSEKLATLEEIKQWLIEGKDEPETFVDLKWQILEEMEEDGKLKMIRVTHPKIPVNLVVVDLENPDYAIKTIRMVIETGVKTIDLPPEDKISLYRLLLDASKLPLVKFYLFGGEHEIGVSVDLDKKSLSKAEFEEALASIILGYTYLVRSLPSKLQKEIIEESFLLLQSLVAKWYRQGIDRRSALRSLLDAGINREMAEELIRAIYGEGKKWSPGITY